MPAGSVTDSHAYSIEPAPDLAYVFGSSSIALVATCERYVLPIVAPRRVALTTSSAMGGGEGGGGEGGGDGATKQASLHVDHETPSQSLFPVVLPAPHSQYPL